MAQATMEKTDAQLKQISDVLNKQVANCAVLFMKLHNYHWFVGGEGFFTLHAKFEEMYDEVKVNMDDIAERLLAVGGRPIGDLKACLSTSSIQEASGKETTEQMVSTLVADLQTIIAELGQGMETAEQAGDDATSDLLLGIRSSFEKHNWMLKAYLGKALQQ